MTANKPSDFVEEASAPSPKRRLFKIAGIGCAGILVLVGIFFAAGAFKAVSCCGDVTSMGQNTQQAAFQANVWAGHLQKGQYDQARALFSPELSGQLDLDGFTAQLKPHAKLIASSVPIVDKISPVLEGDGKDLNALRNVKAWDTIVRFYPDGELLEKPSELLITLRQSLSPKSTEDKPEIYISSFEIKARSIDYAQEAPALRVFNFQRALQLEGLGSAYGQLAPEFQQETDQEAFSSFIKEQAPILLTGDLEIRRVTYHNSASGYTANVVAAVSTKKGDRAIVTYELKRIVQSWGIVGISPLIETKTQASADATPDAAPLTDMTAAPAAEADRAPAKASP